MVMTMPAGPIRHPIRALWEAMREQRRLLVVAAIIGTLASACAVALLGTSAWLISRAAEAPPVLTLTMAAVMVRAFALGRAVLRYGERLIGHDAAFRGLTGLRVRVYEGLERMAPRGVLAGGDLLARLVSDIDAALDLPLRIVLPWAQAALVAAATVAFVMVVLPQDGLALAAVALATLTLAPWAAAWLARRFEHRIAPQKGALAATVVTALRASGDLAAMNAVGSAIQQAREQDAALTRTIGRESRSVGLAAALNTLLMGLAVTAALAIGIPAVGDGRLAPVWLAVVALLPIAYVDVVSTLPTSALALQRLRGSAERVDEVTHAPSSVTVPAVCLPLPGAMADTSTGIEVAGLSAGWAHAVLHDLSFRIEPGTRVAVVGPSGSGKSTLAAVLARFLDYDGSVRLDGVELRDAEPDEVRARIAIMTQRAHLFDTSIAENIRLGRGGIDDATLEHVIDAVGLRSWVDALPQGLATRVGSFGQRVSGGQAQRIALARLLALPSQVVVLDEPTEHLDPMTAAAVQTAIDTAFAGTTLVQITHRLHAVRPDDRVIVLEDGRITQEGPARQLGHQPGWFAAQLARESADDEMRALLTRLPIGVGVPMRAS